ncbi:hypothetical protein [Lentzea sp. NPDC051838]|uniref:hypothetical protein n=1 Tax=Lentzea sp. NPDC051838 TaxID=3154849 RepID=UPI00341D023A
MDPAEVRELLQKRVDVSADELRARMLHALDLLTALRSSVSSASRPAVDAALVLYLVACRKVAFDHRVFHSRAGDRPEPQLIAAQDQVEVDAVVDELDVVQALCDKMGDFYEYFDANGTAITYWQAATYVQHARVTLT